MAESSTSSIGTEYIFRGMKRAQVGTNLELAGRQPASKGRDRRGRLRHAHGLHDRSVSSRRSPGGCSASPGAVCAGWPCRGRRGLAGSAGRWLGLAAFLVGFAGLVLVIDPVDVRRATVDSVLTAWRGRASRSSRPLPREEGVASGLLGAGGAWRWGIRFAWPTGALAVFALVGYRWVAGMVPPEDAAGADDLRRQRTAVPHAASCCSPRSGSLAGPAGPRSAG